MGGKDTEWILGPQNVPENTTEGETRKRKIDEDLKKAGWTLGSDCLKEFYIKGMPNPSSRGFVDYVCVDDDGTPLAVIEAKRASEDAGAGRSQALEYAGILRGTYGKMPIIFLSNGYEIVIIDPMFGERTIHEIYSKKDLQKLHWILDKHESDLSTAEIQEHIINRDYQKRAVRSVCKWFQNKRRRALLVMATGSGKTRTTVALVDVLMRTSWVRNVLFLADRDALVNQAKGVFSKFLPGVAVSKLSNRRRDTYARCIISTYPTMLNCIEGMKDEDGKILFGSGHFDLIIVDEAHRSIYNKYRAIFNHFDALVLGLTATPKKDVDKDTYKFFGIDDGKATDAFELWEAVPEYLVDYKSVEITDKFLNRGIVWGELSEDEKEIYEETFITEDGEIPPSIDSKALNEWIFNESTIVNVINILMKKGLKVDFGSKIGKTVIFAKNHVHAEAIRKTFYKQYPDYPADYCMVIDNKSRDPQSLINKFSDRSKMPQIAVSVDMLDTGIDIPEILNLVFFKPVYSVTKFWQMIGRGTRKCEGLMDGKDKEYFLIFDWCGNFEFFRENPKGIELKDSPTIQAKIFRTKAEMAYVLQREEYQTDELVPFRRELVAELLRTVQQLSRENFAVRQHLRAVDIYSTESKWNMLDFNDLHIIEQELLSLIPPYDSDLDAVQLDALVHIAECKFLMEVNNSVEITEIKKRSMGLMKVTNIPAVAAKKETLRFVIGEGFNDRSGVSIYEKIRTELRELMKYIDRETKVNLNTKFTDEILNVEIRDSELEAGKFVDYPEKFRKFVEKNPDVRCFDKMKHNIPLDDQDILELQKICWEEIGTKDEYVESYGDTPLQRALREITGLDRDSAWETFGKYMDLEKLSNRQHYFLERVVEYVVQNGLIKDTAIFQRSPFTDRGGIDVLFGDEKDKWSAISQGIYEINVNAGTE